MCGIFAETEVISRIAQGEKIEDIISGVHDSITDRIAGMVKRVSLQEQVTITGGGALNQGVVKKLEQRFQTRLNVPENPQIIGAAGAAVHAMERFGLVQYA